MTTTTWRRDPDALAGWCRVRRRHGRPGENTLLWLHGHADDANHPVVPGWTEPFTRGLTRNRIQIVSLDAQGPAWGDDASNTQIDTDVDALPAIAGVSAPVAVLGYSMGTVAAVNFAAYAPSKVSRLILIAPVCDLDTLYAGGGDLATSIDAAYGGDWPTNGTGHDPADLAASLSSIPVDIHYGTADTVIPIAAIATWATAHGNTTVTAHAGADHTDVFDQVDPDDIAQLITG